MRLFELKMPIKIYADCSDGSKFIIVHHIDGMYSYGETENGRIVHLSGYTPLDKKNDGYEIIND